MQPGLKKRSTGLSVRLFFYVITYSLIFMTAQSDAMAQSVLEKKSVQRDTATENKLVALALKGPAASALVHQEKIAKYQVKVAKNSWFNLLSVSTNYNDRSLKPLDNQTYVYPKYFFGLTVPVGMFFTKGPEIKIARENEKIAINNRQANQNTVKVEVLTKYKQYQALTDLLVLQEDVVAEVSAVYTQMEKKFSDGTVSLEVYNAASKRYNEEMAKRINLNLERDIVQLELEKLIGVPLETVIQQ